MPDWLHSKDAYVPPADRDHFIDKSLLSVLGALSRVRGASARRGGFIYGLNPSLKFLLTVAAIVFLSLAQNFYYVLLLFSGIVLAMALMELTDIGRTLALALAVTLFSAVILVPMAAAGQWLFSARLLLKISGSVVAVNTLSFTTKWSRVARTLKLFRVPDIFVLVLDIAMKYIVILGEFSLHLLYALRLRSVGRNDRKRQSLSGLVGVLFLKTREMSELTYSAMECRCFDGRYRAYKTGAALAPADFFYALAWALAFALFFLMGRN